MKRTPHSWDGDVCRFCGFRRFKTRTRDGWNVYYEAPLSKEDIERRVKPWPIMRAPSCKRPEPPPGPQVKLFQENGEPTLDAIQASPGEAEAYLENALLEARDLCH